MNIYFIRHSIAENISIEKLDYDRKITEEGILVLTKSAEIWKNYIEDLDCIYTSPLIRSVQTAGIISEVLQVKEIVKDNSLGTGSNTADVIAIANRNSYKNIAIVGHQPDLSHHINNLCGIGSFNFNFPPAAIAKVEFDYKIRHSSGRLVFFIPPVLNI